MRIEKIGGGICFTASHSELLTCAYRMTNSGLVTKSFLVSLTFSGNGVTSALRRVSEAGA